MHIYDMGFHYGAQLLLLGGFYWRIPINTDVRVSLQSNPDALKPFFVSTSTESQNKMDGQTDGEAGGGV